MRIMKIISESINKKFWTVRHIVQLCLWAFPILILWHLSFLCWCFLILTLMVINESLGREDFRTVGKCRGFRNESLQGKSERRRNDRSGKRWERKRRRRWIKQGRNETRRIIETRKERRKWLEKTTTKKKNTRNWNKKWKEMGKGGKDDEEEDKEYMKE